MTSAVPNSSGRLIKISKTTTPKKRRNVSMSPWLIGFWFCWLIWWIVAMPKVAIKDINNCWNIKDPISAVGSTLLNALIISCSDGSGLLPKLGIGTLTNALINCDAIKIPTKSSTVFRWLRIKLRLSWKIWVKLIGILYPTIIKPRLYRVYCFFHKIRLFNGDLSHSFQDRILLYSLA